MPPRGRIGLTAWTPDGFVGRMLRTVGQAAPPPAGVPSPLAWGDADAVARLLGPGVTVTSTPRSHVFRYADARAWLTVFRGRYGPLRAAFARPDVDAAALWAALTGLATELSTHPRRMEVPSPYLEVVAVKG
ncbi:hypothetical protein [Xylanimonas protaetiae]|uniref:hypothetical protein n=1 Tax=Xylanimonas protaetiae TaxID=2509457 RepID=UPI0024782CEE|nr:hypothetical protein [Xylanimonas protaetiae]